MDLDGNVFNEAEELSNLSAAEPTEDSITKKSKKTGKHRGRNELRGDLETKEIVHTLPEDQRKCAVCGSKLVPFSKEYITTRLCIIPAKIFKITYFREVYKCEHCDKHGDKANIVKAPDLTPAPVIPRGLPEAELIAYIAEAKYLLGEPLYRMEQYFKMQGIYLNRTSLANWIIKSSEWLIPVVKHFWKYAYLEPVLNADETTLRVLKIQGKPVKKLGQMWVVCTGAAAKLLIAIYTYRDSRSKVKTLMRNFPFSAVMTVSCRPMGWGLMVRENICTQAAGRTLAASLWTAYLKMIKTAKRQKLSGSSTEHLPWSVKQEKQTSRRKRYWRCGRKR